MSAQVGRVRLQAAVWLPVLLTLVLAESGLAQSPERAGFVVLRGKDTLATESFERTPLALTGTMGVRVSGQRLGYRYELTPAGTVRRTEIRVWSATAPDTAPPLQHGTMTFSGDSVTIEGNGSLKVAVPAGAIPYLNLSGACLDLLVRRARASSWAGVPVVTPNGQTFTVTVRPQGRDSAVMQLATVELRLALGADGRLLSADVPAQGVRIVRATNVTIGIQPKPDYSAPPGAPYTAESVTVQAAAGVLAGTLTLPKGRAGRLPAVVTITGSGQEDRDESLPMVPGYRPFRQVADTLARRGIAVLRLDDRGFGDSGGNAATATSVDFARDMSAAVSYLSSRADIDPARIALVGHSEGGLIAPLLARDHPKLRALVLMAGPGWTGRRILAYQQRYALTQGVGALSGAKLDSALAQASVALDSVARVSPWIRFFLDYDPLATARQVRTPVLILQGATDRQVPAEQAAELAAAFRAGGNKDVTVRVFPDRDHLFLRDPSGNPARYDSLPSRTIDSEVMGTLADWLVRKLAPAKAAPAGQRK